MALLVLGIVGALPLVGEYMPSSLPAAKLVLGEDPGNFLGPLLFNLALVPALFGATWLAFRRQEL